MEKEFGPGWYHRLECHNTHKLLNEAIANAHKTKPLSGGTLAAFLTKAVPIAHAEVAKPCADEDKAAGDAYIARAKAVWKGAYDRHEPHPEGGYIPIASKVAARLMKERIAQMKRFGHNKKLPPLMTVRSARSALAMYRPRLVNTDPERFHHMRLQRYKRHRTPWHVAGGAVSTNNQGGFAVVPQGDDRMRPSNIKLGDPFDWGTQVVYNYGQTKDAPIERVAMRPGQKGGKQVSHLQSMPFS